MNTAIGRGRGRPKGEAIVVVRKAALKRTVKMPAGALQLAVIRRALATAPPLL